MEGLKVFLTVGFGSGIGSLVALSVATYLWWVGLIVGGLTGYLSYEYKRIPIAGRQAWIYAINWRPSWSFWKEVGRRILWMQVAYTTFMLMSVAIGSLFRGGLPPPPNLEQLLSLIKLFTVVALFSAIATISGGIGDDPEEPVPLKKRNDGLKQINPVNVMIVLLKMVWWCVTRLPRGCMVTGLLFGRATVKIGRFIRAFFLFVHSDVRLLCGLDSAIGTVAGYFAGSVIIGALAGGLWGLLNYQFVSVWWLRLVPAKK